MSRRAAARRQRCSHLGPTRCFALLRFYEKPGYDLSRDSRRRAVERSRLTTSIWVGRRRVSATSVLIGLKSAVANRPLMNPEGLTYRAGSPAARDFNTRRRFSTRFTLWRGKSGSGSILIYISISSLLRGSSLSKITWYGRYY